MTLYLTPAFGEPVPDKRTGKAPVVDLRERIEVYADTVHLLWHHGMEVEVAPEDREVARILTMSYAEDPEKTSKAATPANVGRMRPASIILTDQILQEFSHEVVESGAQLRHFVTNKLINEADHPDGRIRIRALELLGKISDVGLFAEKSEVTVTHKTSDSLRDELRQKLERLAKAKDITPKEEAVSIDKNKHDDESLVTRQQGQEIDVQATEVHTSTESTTSDYSDTPVTQDTSGPGESNEAKNTPLSTDIEDILKELDLDEE